MTQMTKIGAVEKLHKQLKEDILNRKYSPGDKLPSEREIMKQLVVGRGTVRETYRLLQQEGMVESRHGGGTYVTELNSTKVGETLAILIRHGQVSLDHIFEFRELIETQCAALAAERATPDQINHLSRMVDEMEKLDWTSKKGNLEFYEMELELHVHLAAITKNPIFEWFNSTFKQNATKFSKILVSVPEEPKAAVKDWRELIRAMENNEVNRAATIMRVHCYHFQRIMQETDGKNQNSIA